MVIYSPKTVDINYSFKVTNPPTTTTELTLGNTVNGTISQLGEIDEYTFTGTAGQRLYYDALIVNTSSYIRLISPSGKNLTTVFLTKNVDSDSDIFTLTETGTYKLIIGSNSKIGNYSFRLIDVNNTPTITLGTVVTDTLTPGLETNIYRVNGKAGQRLFFNSLIGWLYSTPPVSWSLYGPGNENITDNYNYSSDFDVTLDNDGTYLLVLSGYLNDGNFNYNFKVSDTTSTLTFGSTITSTISQPGEIIDEYTFTATAGQYFYYDALIDKNTSSIFVQLITPTSINAPLNANNDVGR